MTHNEHERARRQERTAFDPRDVSGIESINAAAEAKQEAMNQTNPHNADDPIEMNHDTNDERTPRDGESYAKDESIRPVPPHVPNVPENESRH